MQDTKNQELSVGPFIDFLLLNTESQSLLDA